MFLFRLRTGFAPLLHGDGGGINMVFKVLDSCFKTLYKENEEATYHFQIRRADYGRGLLLLIRDRLL